MQRSSDYILAGNIEIYFELLAFNNSFLAITLVAASVCNDYIIVVKY